MIDKQELSWRQFMETGQISDYLDYRGVAQAGQNGSAAHIPGGPMEVERLAADGGRPGDPGAQHG